MVGLLRGRRRAAPPRIEIHIRGDGVNLDKRTPERLTPTRVVTPTVSLISTSPTPTTFRFRTSTGPAQNTTPLSSQGRPTTAPETPLLVIKEPPTPRPETPTMTVTQTARPETPTATIFITTSAKPLIVTVTAQIEESATSSAPSSTGTGALVAGAEDQTNSTAIAAPSLQLDQQRGVISGRGVAFIIVLSLLAGLSLLAIPAIIIWRRRKQKKTQEEEMPKGMAEVVFSRNSISVTQSTTRFAP